MYYVDLLPYPRWCRLKASRWNLGIVTFIACLTGFEELALALEPRPAWTQSRIVGSPEPPLPFVLERVYPGVGFDCPVSIHPVPGEPWILVCEQKGKIKAFSTIGEPDQVELLADFVAEPPPLSEVEPGNENRIVIYNLTFHPEFATNRKVFVCYVVPGTQRPTKGGSHVASFQLSDTQPPSLLLDTEKTILRFDSGGHNGATLVFGNDGFLYVSIGDTGSPTPPDPYNHGQDIGDVHSSILRIDVDGTSENSGGEILPYRIPQDNPFVDLPSARPEIYAYGFRNPWRRQSIWCHPFSSYVEQTTASCRGCSILHWERGRVAICNLRFAWGKLLRSHQIRPRGKTMERHCLWFRATILANRLTTRGVCVTSPNDGEALSNGSQHRG